MGHCRPAATSSTCRSRKNQRGFALLLVFLMAALIGITLYMEIPRVAMQAQRDKEQTLIDRGEQYKRAIQLFVNKAKRYPGDIKELENFQNQRFLRHRYIDPMTGKDEWRIIHIQNGVLTDSKLTKPTGPGGKEEPKAPNGFVGELAGLGASPNATQGAAAGNPRDRRRTSDGNNSTMPGPAGLPGGDMQNSGAPPSPGQTADNGQAIPGQQGQPGALQPGALQSGMIQPGQAIPVLGQQGMPGQVGMPGQQGMPGQVGMPGQQGMPGQVGMTGQPGIPGQQGFPTQPGFQSQQGFPTQSGLPPGTLRTGAQPGPAASTGNSFVGGGGSFVGGGVSLGSQQAYPTQQQNLPGQPGAPVNSQQGGVSPYPVQPGANGMPPGFPQPGAVAGGQSNSAADMIRNILTTPRPGGMPQGMTGAQTIGGGIAGVASNGEGEGVKVYNDRTLYQEWEFIFDPQKQKQIPNPNAQGAGGTPADRMNQGTQPSSPGTNPGTIPGMNPGANPMTRPIGQ